MIYFQTQGLLLSDQSILSSFLPLIKASAADFQRFANGLTAAQHLRNLENELQSMIALLRRLQAIFNIVSWTNKMLITKVVVEVYDWKSFFNVFLHQFSVQYKNIELNFAPRYYKWVSPRHESFEKRKCLSQINNVSCLFEGSTTMLILQRPSVANCLCLKDKCWKFSENTISVAL